MLASTKAKAQEVGEKLKAADETKISINEKREQFRPVATRGSCLYFAIVEMSAVNPMYQTSLAQFLGLFMSSMDRAERASLASKRVENIIETMTYITYRYINRGFYEKDKLTFILICTLKILVTAGLLKGGDVTLFLRGRRCLDINTAKRKPFGWMTNDSWLNILALADALKFFANMPSDMSANESIWRKWYEDNEPEQLAIPDYETRISENVEIGPFLRTIGSENAAHGPVHPTSSRFHQVHAADGSQIRGTGHGHDGDDVRRVLCGGAYYLFVVCGRRPDGVHRTPSKEEKITTSSRHLV